MCETCQFVLELQFLSKFNQIWYTVAHVIMFLCILISRPSQRSRVTGQIFGNVLCSSQHLSWSSALKRFKFCIVPSFCTNLCFACGSACVTTNVCVFEKREIMLSFWGVKSKAFDVKWHFGDSLVLLQKMLIYLARSPHVRYASALCRWCV